MPATNEWTRWKALETQFKWVRTHLAFLGGFLGVVVAVTFGFERAMRMMNVPAIVTARGAGFILGGGICFIFAFVWFRSGSFNIGAGADAEEWTATALKKFRKAGYRSINNVQFQGFNVDHVAIGPAGAFVIETKWASAPWALTEGRIEGPVRDPISQARAAAHQMHRFLNLSQKMEISIFPVLVVWGPGQPTLDVGAEARGVILLTGRMEDHWASVFTSGSFPEEKRDQAVTALSAFAKERMDYERKASGHRFSYRTTLFLGTAMAYGVAIVLLFLWVLLKVAMV